MAELPDMKSLIDYLSRVFKNKHETLNTVILIGDLQGLRTRE